MWTRSRHVAGILRSMAGLGRAFWSQKQYAKGFLKNPLFGQKLTAAEQKKVGQYVLFVPVLSGDNFSTLRQEPINEAERKCLSWSAVFSALYDMFLDDYNMTSEQLRNMALSYDTFVPETAAQEVYQYACFQAQDFISDRNLFFKYAGAVCEAQIDSAAQAERLPYDTLLDITMRKGGYSACLARMLFSHPMQLYEEQALVSYGGLMQMIEDTFDTWEDLQEPLFTLPNSTTDIKEIRQLVMNKLSETKKLISRLSYPERGKQVFVDRLCFFVARGLVCLEQFEALQKRQGGIFKPQELSRSELICDMEKPANLWRNFVLAAEIRSI